jgi:tetratricopeptide (TPR) repeat protein
MNATDPSAKRLSVIRDAIERGDPSLAKAALQQIDILLGTTTDKNDRKYLLFRKSSCFGILRDFAHARQHLSLALQEDPQSLDGKLTYEYLSGLLYQQEGEYEAALTKLNDVSRNYTEAFKCVELRFMYEDIQQRRAFLSVTLSRFEDAIPLLNETISFGLEQQLKSDALASLGLCYLELSDYVSARDHFVKAIDIGLTERWLGRAHFYLGIAYFYTDMLEEARQEFLTCETQAGVNGVPMFDVFAWLCTTSNLLGDAEASERYARLANPS